MRNLRNVTFSTSLLSFNFQWDKVEGSKQEIFYVRLASGDMLETGPKPFKIKADVMH